MKDPYAILGVAKSASQEEIKNAFRTLAKKCHPDMSPGDKEAERRFKEINAAYEILGDSEKREKFDRGEWGGEAGTSSTDRKGFRDFSGVWSGADRARSGFEFGTDFDADFFQEFFSGMRGRGNGGSFRRRGADQHYRMELGMPEAVRGGEREVQFPSGKRLLVTIPKGVFSGQVLRFPGQGEPGAEGGSPGDLYVELVVKIDHRFQQQGSQLHCELSVPVDVAVLGGEALVPIPEGAVKLQIPPRSNAGQRIRIPGKGLFAKGGKARGDFIVTLKLVLPENMDSSFVELMQRWQAERKNKAS